MADIKKIKIGNTEYNVKDANAVTSVNNVQPVNGNVTIPTGGREPAEIITSTIPRTDAELHLPDGALINGSGIYSAFVDYMADLYENTTIPADGTNWSTPVQNTNLTSSNWRSVTYGNEKFVALNYYGYISTSTDGITWTQAVQNITTSEDWHDLTYDGTNFVAINYVGYISTSTDSITWTTDKKTRLGSRSWVGITYGNNRFVIVGHGGYTSTSTDGITWTSPVQTLTGGTTWSRVAYGNNKFVAINYAGYISTSTDGATWTTGIQVNELGHNGWEGIIYDGVKFVALSDSGYISTSTDGTTWTQATQNKNLGSVSAWQKVAYGKSIYTALDGNGYTAISIPTLPAEFCTETEWQQSVTDYGSCDKYVYDSTNNTIRLPKKASEHGGLIASSTSGTSWYRIYADGWCEQGGLTAGSTTNLKVITFTKPYIDTNYAVLFGNSYTNAATSTSVVSVNTKATTGFSVYDGTNVNFLTYWQTKGYVDISSYQQNLLYEYIVLATTTKTQIEVDIDEIVTDLNGKADKDLSNISTGAFEAVVNIAQNSGRETVVGWCMPDYSNRILLNLTSSTSFTAPSHGWILGNFNIAGSGSGIIYVNGQLVGKDNNNNQTTTIPVSKNDVVTCNGTENDELWFQPAKGVS